MAPMARDGVEANRSMGTDIPLAVLSDKSKLLYDTSSSSSRRVTNPPIDCIREEIVTSGVTTLGPSATCSTDAGELSSHRAEVADPHERGTREAEGRREGA